MIVSSFVPGEFGESESGKKVEENRDRLKDLGSLWLMSWECGPERLRVRNV